MRKLVQTISPGNGNFVLQIVMLIWNSYLRKQIFFKDFDWKVPWRRKFGERSYLSWYQRWIRNKSFHDESLLVHVWKFLQIKFNMIPDSDQANSSFKNILNFEDCSGNQEQTFVVISIGEPNHNNSRILIESFQSTIVSRATTITHDNPSEPLRLSSKNGRARSFTTYFSIYHGARAEGKVR